VLGGGYRLGVGVVRVLAEGVGGVLIVVRGSGKVLAMGMGQVLAVVRGSGKVLAEGVVSGLGLGIGCWSGSGSGQGVVRVWCWSGSGGGLECWWVLAVVTEHLTRLTYTDCIQIGHPT
jgi:hypothetical protein